MRIGDCSSGVCSSDLLLYPRNGPFMLSAFGPKAVKLAGEIADGVILFSGAKQLDKLAQQIALFRDAARSVGRDPSQMHIRVTSFCSVQETRAQAIDDIKAFLASSPAAFPRTREALEALPVVYRERILEYRSRYDPTEHVVPGGRNAAAIDELEIGRAHV